MKNKAGVTVVELLIVVMIIAIIASIFFSFSGEGLSRSEGDRVGKVIKLSNKGIFFKTWEGQLIAGGQGVINQGLWNFSVVDPEVVEKLKKAMETQTMVKLSYKQNLLYRPWKGSTTYFITDVHFLEEKEE